MYCDRIRAKVINPKPKIKIKKISNSVSYVNADNSIGFVAADFGIKQAIKNSKKNWNRSRRYQEKWALWSFKFLC